jgi:hypothetical protein
MDDGHWNDLAPLGEQMSLLSQQQPSRADGCGDAQEVRRLGAQIATIQAARQDHLKDRGAFRSTLTARLSPFTPRLEQSTLWQAGDRTGRGDGVACAGRAQQKERESQAGERQKQDTREIPITTGDTPPSAIEPRRRVPRISDMSNAATPDGS